MFLFVSGIVGLLSLSIAYNIKSFGAVIASLSVIAGIYFLLNGYFVVSTSINNYIIG